MFYKYLFEHLRQTENLMWTIKIIILQMNKWMEGSQVKR